MSSAQAPVGGFSLFPNTSRPPSRSQSRPRAVTPQGRPASTEPSPPRVGRRASLRRGSSATREERPREERRRMAPSNNPWQQALDNPLSPDDDEQPQQQPQHQHQQQQQPPSQQPPQQQPRHQQRAQPQQYQPEPQPEPQLQPHALSVDTSVMNRPRDYPSAISASDVPPRCETALSDARTLVRSPSVSSISKPPLVYDPRDRGGGVGTSGSTSHAAAEPSIRSMFPQYNPELPLDRQDYFPTQTSPVHIPQSAISRAMYSPRSPEAAAAPIRHAAAAAAATVTTTHPVASARSPSAASQHQHQHQHRFHTTSAATTPQRAPHHAHHHEPRAPPPVSTTEDLRSLWKVTNGWKASSLEGRIFCLKMTTQPDCPVYTLSSSSSQPFYSLRIDPTSASAYVSLSRFDPTKPFKGAKPGTTSTTSPSPSPTPSSPGTPPPQPSKSSLKHDAKHWHPVLATQLEPPLRRQPPNDGLVAQLWPTAAARLATSDPAAAEHECARLVWDADSNAHFLVHPALAVPFCVTVERHPAFARTEYTLEHLESPVHLGRLTRDGTGAGYLEVDTGIAAKVDAVYLVDVVVAALVLVAHADEEWREVETFEPPPSVLNGVEGGGAKRGSRRSSRASKREAAGERKVTSRLEQFEMDIESQTSELKKGGRREKDKVPGVARGIIAVITVLFKCVIWCFTLVFRALTGLVRCLSSDKI
ncbi:hypothetical protein B0T18DRAFT_24850 [Schizothecium vesticola]|uniref:Acetylserotonin methytransferase-like protein n=1 Tax=Schizothecium vesticola TaxID=314040 RepID=A0AA40FAW8_9PEZI|nr:hypothetical protein B0T18DRAFT_24850 [Schizothecium vesticola]